MIELLSMAAFGLNLLVLWKLCERQPFHVHVYIVAEDIEKPDDRLEGDEWKDGPSEDSEL